MNYKRHYTNLKRFKLEPNEIKTICYAKDTVVAENVF